MKENKGEGYILLSKYGECGRIIIYNIMIKSVMEKLRRSGGSYPRKTYPWGFLPKHKTSVGPTSCWFCIKLSTHVQLLLLVYTSNIVGAINPKVINYYINTLFTIKCRFHSKDFYGAFVIKRAVHNYEVGYRIIYRPHNFLSNFHFN